MHTDSRACNYDHNHRELAFHHSLELPSQESLQIKLLFVHISLLCMVPTYGLQNVNEKKPLSLKSRF